MGVSDEKRRKCEHGGPGNSVQESNSFLINGKTLLSPCIAFAFEAGKGRLLLRSIDPPPPTGQAGEGRLLLFLSQHPAPPPPQ